MRFLAGLGHGAGAGVSAVGSDRNLVPWRTEVTATMAVTTRKNHELRQRQQTHSACREIHFGQTARGKPTEMRILNTSVGVPTQPTGSGPFFAQDDEQFETPS